MRILLLLLICLLSACFSNQKPILIIPEPKRDEIFTRFINPITEKYQILKLRETALSNDDLEIRVWLSAFEIDGFILKRINNNWAATAIKEIDCKTYDWYPKDKSYPLVKINLQPPKSGWERFWLNLNQLDISNIPYSNYILMIDETGYILETNINGVYRIRFYGSKDKSKEAEQMKKICALIADEFGLINFEIGSLCVENNAKL